MTTNDEPRKPVDEALDRLAATANASIDKLIQELNLVRGQRDDLARCLREAVDGFQSGRFLCLPCTRPDDVMAFVGFFGRAQAALLRLEERLEYRVAAERKGDA